MHFNTHTSYLGCSNAERAGLLEIIHPSKNNFSVSCPDITKNAKALLSIDCEGYLHSFIKTLIFPRVISSPLVILKSVTLPESLSNVLNNAPEPFVTLIEP